MIFRTNSRPSKKDSWHRWFAWYPVLDCGDIYWLETVVRKRTYHSGGGMPGGGWTEWSYDEIKKK
jgi:hypothetical protein